MRHVSKTDVIQSSGGLGVGSPRASFLGPTNLAKPVHVGYHTERYPEEETISIAPGQQKFPVVSPDSWPYPSLQHRLNFL